MASAIRGDRHLESLALVMANGFTNGAGVVLVEALTINKTLVRILFMDDSFFDSDHVDNKASLGTQIYKASIWTFLRSTILLVMKGVSRISNRCVLSSD